MKKITIILVLLFMLVVLPLNTYTKPLALTITAEEAAISLQKIFDEYGKGKYKVAEYDKNKKLNKKEVEIFLEDMEKNLIEQNVKSKEMGTTEYEDKFLKSTTNTNSFSRIIHNTTFYESENFSVGLGIFGSGKVNVTWFFTATTDTYQDPNPPLVLPYFISASNPYDISSSYSGIGQVVYNNIVSSCTLLCNYEPYPITGVIFTKGCYSKVSGEIQILVNALINFTFTDQYCADIVESLV